MTDTISNILTYASGTLFHKTGEPILFCSGTFWAMFILFILLYSLIRNRKTQMMLYVTAFSLYFFYKSNGIIFFILPVTTFVDWALALVMNKVNRPTFRKLCLAYSICLSVGVLLSFKYTGFFFDTWNSLLAGNLRLPDIFLPVGISFYTFQTISYVTDVYRRRISPTRSFLEYLFYISFFPLILAGPIMRADKFLPQIRSNKRISREMIYGGLWLIITGIIKKAIFADYIAQYNNWVFDNPLLYSGFEGFMAVIGYSAQIYCDFSGYSDMSIGIASIMGFDLGKNFNLPYQSLSLNEFWHRWHISLSEWMRDYVYIPLGGNRKGILRTYLNSLMTMLIAGLWHGASWMFIIWGGLHGVGLILQKLNRPWLDKLPDSRPVKVICWLLTFAFVSFLWIFFRAESPEKAMQLIVHIGSDFNIAHARPFLHARTTWCIFLFSIFLFHSIHTPQYERIRTIFIRSPWIVKLLVFIVVAQLVLQFRTGDIQPFIYFRF